MRRTGRSTTGTAPSGVESAFDQPSELPRLYQFKNALCEMRTASNTALEGLANPASFSALKTRKGMDGEWPQNGLYECLNWPVRKET
jgi:hypothetical protein